MRGKGKWTRRNAGGQSEPESAEDSVVKESLTVQQKGAGSWNRLLRLRPVALAHELAGVGSADVAILHLHERIQSRSFPFVRFHPLFHDEAGDCRGVQTERSDADQHEPD